MDIISEELWESFDLEVVKLELNFSHNGGRLLGGMVLSVNGGVGLGLLDLVVDLVLAVRSLLL